MFTVFCLQKAYICVQIHYWSAFSIEHIKYRVVSLLVSKLRSQMSRQWCDKTSNVYCSNRHQDFWIRINYCKSWGGAAMDQFCFYSTTHRHVLWFTSREVNTQVKTFNYLLCSSNHSWGFSVAKIQHHWLYAWFIVIDLNIGCWQCCLLTAFSSHWPSLCLQQ